MTKKYKNVYQYSSLTHNKITLWIKCIETLQTEIIDKQLNDIYKLSNRDIQSLWIMLRHCADIFFDDCLFPDTFSKFIQLILRLSQSAAKHSIPINNRSPKIRR